MSGIESGIDDTTAAGLLALLSTAALAALHLLAPRIRGLPLVPEHATASFAGGLAVSYVFLHLLPELVEGHGRLQELLGDERTPGPVQELAIFVVALSGFVLFYGLERLAERRGPEQRGQRATRQVFWIHLGAFALYNGVITYTLPLTYRTGLAFALLFTVAMGLHFVLSDRGLEHHYGAAFDRWGPRLFLAASLLAGWGLAVLFAPTRALTVSLLTAFLAGSVLLNVFKEELPSTRRSSFPWFLTGLVLYALLLGVLTMLGGEE